MARLDVNVMDPGPDLLERRLVAHVDLAFITDDDTKILKLIDG